MFRVDLTWDARHGACWLKFAGMEVFAHGKEDKELGILLRDMPSLIKTYGPFCGNDDLQIGFRKLWFHDDEHNNKVRYPLSKDDLAELKRFLACWISVTIDTEYILPAWFINPLTKTASMIKTNSPLPFLRSGKVKAKKLRCIRFYGDDEDVFWRVQPYTSMNILTGITHLFLNDSNLNIHETFQSDLLVYWLKSDDSKTLQSVFSTSTITTCHAL